MDHWFPYETEVFLTHTGGYGLTRTLLYEINLVIPFVSHLVVAMLKMVTQ